MHDREGWHQFELRLRGLVPEPLHAGPRPERADEREKEQCAL